jgi:hypothetical protein
MGRSVTQPVSITVTATPEAWPGGPAVGYPLGTINGVQIEMGLNLSASFSTKYQGMTNRPIFLMGGQVKEAGSGGTTLVDGSNTLYRYDPLTKTLAEEHPYYLPAGKAQPGHPSGVALMGGAEIGTGSLYCYAGHYISGMPWGGASKPIANYDTWYHHATKLWQDTPALPPAYGDYTKGPLAADDNRGGHYLRADAGGIMYLVNQTGSDLTWVLNDLQGNVTFSNLYPAPRNTFQPHRAQAVVISYGGGGLFAFDWRTGEVISINPDRSSPTLESWGFLLPPLPSERFNVSVAFSGQYKQIWYAYPRSFSKTIKILDVYSRAVIDGPELPAGIDEFGVMCWNPETNEVIGFGDVKGSSKAWHYPPVDLHPLPDVPAQGGISDTRQGLSYQYYNGFLRLEWAHRPGDFVNNQGVEHANANWYGQGSYLDNDTTQTVNIPGLMQLVEEWRSGVNTGAFIIAQNSVTLATRFHTTPAYRPKLVVTTASGTYDCPCTASGSTSGSGGNPVNNMSGGPTMPTGYMDGNAYAFVQFDLSSIVGAVTGAVLTVTLVGIQFGGNGYLRVFKIKPVFVRTDNAGLTLDTSGTVLSGDINTQFGNNPIVLISTDFSKGWFDGPIAGCKRWGPDQYSPVSCRGTQPEPALGGRYSGRWYYEYGGGAPIGWVMRTYPRNGQHYEELWFEYKMMFESGSWNSCTDGPKLPGGFTTQYATPTQRPPGLAMSNGDGNGGATNHGWETHGTGVATFANNLCFHDHYYIDAYAFYGTPNLVFSTTGSLPAPLIPGTTYYCRQKGDRLVSLHKTLADSQANINPIVFTSGGSGTHTWTWPGQYVGWSGASLRINTAAECIELNPYRKVTHVYSYVYHMDVTGYGDGFPWDPIYFRRGRFYKIKMHMRVNSITGPYDQFGNGVGVKDGIYQVWVDDVLSVDKHNLRWRRHPNYRIDGVWWDAYHGGMLQPQADHYFRLADIIVATENFVSPA